MTNGTRMVSVSRVIPAPPEDLFAVLTSPAGHSAIDGSDSVKGATQSKERLGLGDKFSMKMKIGVPYRITNEIVEFETNRLIAWRHLGRHRWRYELEPVAEGTRVTETFDWSTSFAPRLIELLGYPAKHPASMTRTLERLEEHVTKR